MDTWIGYQDDGEEEEKDEDEGRKKKSNPRSHQEIYNFPTVYFLHIHFFLLLLFAR